MTKTRRKKPKKRGLTAATADPHRCYELSVQDPVEDVAFLTHLYEEHRGRPPLFLREDFCGTAALCAEWVKSDPRRRAVGLDLDRSTLAWAKKHNLAPLGDARERMVLHRGDVLDGWPEKADAIVAFNFSYCVLRERAQLLRYFRSVRKGLRAKGLFVLDIHGGPDAQSEGEEETEKDGFTYVWDQGTMDALTARSTRHIHFRFPDGSEISRAFSYHWRIWTLPELRDLLDEAGFARVEVYWEEADEKGDRTGMFTPVREAGNEESWIAHVVSWKIL